MQFVADFMQQMQFFRLYAGGSFFHGISQLRKIRQTKGEFLSKNYHRKKNFSAPITASDEVQKRPPQNRDIYFRKKAD